MTESTPGNDSQNKPVDVASGDALRRLVDDHELVLVEFYTDNCGICASVEPVVGRVVRTRG